MIETEYICTGGCGGKVSEEEYNAGKQTCGAAACPNYGKPFEKRARCTECEQLIGDTEKHKH